jgi:DNA-binding winged helix-turn-helix (wHTH) protein/Tol biopolymer transport system component
MAEQYWIGGFFVDVSRNQITHNKNSQSLPPKALAVLNYLAENQGQVVSQEDLLTHVWKDTVVSPNTLQRCIAQLRKALGDDGKVQSFIKTHAKRGYSLECDVRWQADDSALLTDKQEAQYKAENAIEVSDTPIKTDEKKPIKWLNLIAASILVLVVGILITNAYLSKPTSQLTIKNIRPLTSTDDRELASIYSPDGNYVVFKRFPEVLCINHLWAKNIKTQEEFQLTKDLGSFDSISFSDDGKTLAFIKADDCGKPVTQKSCFQLQSLDFGQALTSPQTPTTHMECKNSEITNTKWINNDEILLFQKHSNRWQLISYSISNNRSKTLYALQYGNLIDYDYSPSQNLIALTSVQNDGQFYIETLKPDGHRISSHPIVYPEEIPKFRYIYPNFSALDSQLIFSTGRQLFTLSYDGQITDISLPLDVAMSTPVFHPDGKRMLAIKGHYDSDVVSVPLSQLTNEDNISDITNLSYNVLERSTFQENLARYQPGGTLIAYTSRRSGNSQVWFTNGNGSQQLSHFPMDTYVTGLIWSADGQSVLVNVVSELKRLYLDGRETTIHLEQPVYSLFHWDNDKQTVIAMMRQQGVEKFVEINMANSDIRVINDKSVAWAHKSENGQLIYMDNIDRFWQPGAAEDQLITALDGQGSDKGFIIKDNVIYGINDNFQLWSYALDDKAFRLIGYLPNTIDHITDIHQQQLLMTMRIAARKDVVELTLN